MSATGCQSVEQGALRADVAVIGGGVSGLCAALYLARGGAEVVLLEAGMIAGQGSSANAGTLALQNKRPPMLPFFIEGVEEWRRLAESLELDIGYGRTWSFSKSRPVACGTMASRSIGWRVRP
jgi:glycine/D-amino acid oxidase-like deaminating enzyme